MAYTLERHVKLYKNCPYTANSNYRFAYSNRLGQTPQTIQAQLHDSIIRHGGALVNDIRQSDTQTIPQGLAPFNNTQSSFIYKTFLTAQRQLKDIMSINYMIFATYQTAQASIYPQQFYAYFVNEVEILDQAPQMLNAAENETYITVRLHIAPDNWHTHFWRTSLIGNGMVLKSNSNRVSRHAVGTVTLNYQIPAVQGAEIRRPATAPFNTAYLFARIKITPPPAPALNNNATDNPTYCWVVVRELTSRTPKVFSLSDTEELLTAINILSGEGIFSGPVPPIFGTGDSASAFSGGYIDKTVVIPTSIIVSNVKPWDNYTNYPIFFVNSTFDAGYYLLFLTNTIQNTRYFSAIDNNVLESCVDWGFSILREKYYSLNNTINDENTVTATNLKTTIHRPATRGTPTDETPRGIIISLALSQFSIKITIAPANDISQSVDLLPYLEARGISSLGTESSTNSSLEDSLKIAGTLASGAVAAATNPLGIISTATSLLSQADSIINSNATQQKGITLRGDTTTYDYRTVFEWYAIMPNNYIKGQDTYTISGAIYNVVLDNETLTDCLFNYEEDKDNVYSYMQVLCSFTGAPQTALAEIQKAFEQGVNLVYV